MERFKNILVATDTRLDHHPIVEEAAEIAQHNGAKLKIVDVVPEFGWTDRLALKDGVHLGELRERLLLFGSRYSRSTKAMWSLISMLRTWCQRSARPSAG